MLKLIAIAAMASNRVIGRDGDLPWHLPEDLRFFKRTTMGHAVLMGRKTYDSILARLGRPLPGRLNVVMSRSREAVPGAHCIRSLDELERVEGVTSPVYLIGGAMLYEALLPLCDELLLTQIHEAVDGDAWFPPFEVMFEEREVLASGEKFRIVRYVRSSLLPALS